MVTAAGTERGGMDIRAQVSMVFHLDKCIGCHTCSIACKNIWTDRKGAEYMWWNNVETKPGTGYPTLWEDQDKYQGGFEQKRRRRQAPAPGQGRDARQHLRQPEPADRGRLLRALDVRLPGALRRSRRATTSRRPARSR